MNKLEELADRGCQVSLFVNLINKNWHMVIEGNQDGIALKITQHGLELSDVIETAYQKFMANAPPAMLTPLLEQPKSDDMLF